MPQNDEAAAFLARVAELPPGLGVSLDAVLQPSLDDEAQLRKLFAQDKTNARLSDPHVGLVDVFEAPSDIRVTRARVVQDESDLFDKYVMPLPAEKRRKEGTPCMVENLEEFKQNWSIFTEGSLSLLTNWDNVIAAGGAIQACLTPVPDNYKVSKRALRKHFHSNAYPSSDVDIFLYGLTPAQAEIKINEIYEAVRDSVPWDTTCIRTKHTVSIHSQYPYRAVQIVLRLYQTPAEILAGFDVDSPCCAYDGNKVWANPRAIIAMMRQCNTVDVTRRSPSYEVRLSKYFYRGFEIYVPQLKRDDIDPTIFERSIVRIQGLARLLVLEKLATAVARDQYLVTRRTLRGRPQKPYNWKRYAKRKYKGDLKQDADNGLELSDYDVVSLHLPYGPGWDARRIEKLVYQTDLGMNSPFNPKNEKRTLHRHAAFFGTMKECLEDCCEFCPEPDTEEDKALQEEEDKNYLRGRISFIEEDPGRQSTSGSFNPIDDGEWSEMAYMGATEKFFAAIVSHDRVVVKRMIEEGADVNRRDHVGRTPLQMAVLSKAEDIACDLVDADARMTVRLVDGRTALHIASQLGFTTVIRKFLERSAQNAEAAEAEEEAKQKDSKRAEESESMDIDISREDSDEDDEDSEMRDSSEDDWESDEDRPRRKQKTTEEKPAGDEAGMNIPEDEEDVPDVFDLKASDWDYGFSALDYAIIGGSVSAVELLVAAGADPKSVNKLNSAQSLSLTAATRDDEAACKIIEKLLAAGAVSSEAEWNLFTNFHRMLLVAKPKLVATLLRVDPNAKAVLDVPWMDAGLAIFPVVTTIVLSSCSMLAILLAHGAKLTITEDDLQRAKDMGSEARMSHSFGYAPIMPAEIALARQDDIIHLLVALGADINSITKSTSRNAVDQGRMSLLDFVRTMVAKAKDSIKPAPTNPAPPAVGMNLGLGIVSSLGTGLLGTSGLLGVKSEQPPVWQTELQKILDACNKIQTQRQNINQQPGVPFVRIKAYYEEAESLLAAHGAKTAAELASFDGSEEERKVKAFNNIYGPYIQQYLPQPVINNLSFWRISGSIVSENTTLTTLYKELFTACWNGDNVKIQRLCLPQSNYQHQYGPLQVAVRWGDYYRGFTPLHMAFMRRHWETAKLVLAIAAAQYNPDEPESQPFQTKNITLDDGSDSEQDDDEDDEMEEVADEPINFVDVAKRPTTAHSKARPLDILAVPGLHLSADSSTYNTHKLVVEAIALDDFEAFTRILDLYRFVQEGDSAEEYAWDVLPALLNQYDRPAMLNEYIMRTGLGISIKSHIEDTTDKAKQDSKVYLGLNVHGKKRKDLATKGDPNARVHGPTTEPIPSLWQAVRTGQLDTIKYLASTQPAEAYRLYALSHSDERAKLLKKIPDLAASVPSMLGWTVNAFNESVLTAAVISNRKDAIEVLSMLRPNEIAGLAQLQHKTFKFNLLLAAARWACDPWVFDFLLGQKVSPAEIDYRGFNVYHLLCSYNGENYLRLFKHILHQLPEEVTDFLLRQQSKEARNTPLHVAIKCNRLDYVRLLVQTGAAQYLERDANGCIPLHLAVKFAHPEITRLVATAGPIEALTMEDSVGTTPLETATRDTFVHEITATQSQRHLQNLQSLPPSYDWNRKAFDVAKQEKELVRFRETIHDLHEQGRLINGTKLSKELIAYASHLEAKIATQKTVEEEESKSKEESEGWTAEKDVQDTPTTLRVLLELLAAKSGTTRRLVHLSDVHDSVQTSFAATLEEEKTLNRINTYREQKDNEFEEQDTEKQPEATLLTSDYPTLQQWNGDIWHKL